MTDYKKEIHSLIKNHKASNIDKILRIAQSENWDITREEISKFIEEMITEGRLKGIRAGNSGTLDYLRIIAIRNY